MEKSQATFFKMGHEFENKIESAKKFQISKIEEPFL